MIKSDPKGVEYDRFTLEWSARSVSPITSFKVEYKMMSDAQWKEVEVEAYQLPNEDNTYAGTHMIANLNPATVYLAKVSSRNVYGFSNPSQAFKFATRGAGNLSWLIFYNWVDMQRAEQKTCEDFATPLKMAKCLLSLFLMQFSKR